MRSATLTDLELLVALMGEFYAESAYPLDTDRAAAAFRELLADPRLGAVWVIQSRDNVAGYVVVTFGYSMEYEGRDAFIDDLFVRPAFRNAGLGKEAVAEVSDYCRNHNVRALHLEVARDNPRAQHVYQRAGFRDTNRQLLTLRLAADPS